jgi:uncharacterized protein
MGVARDWYRNNAVVQLLEAALIRRVPRNHDQSDAAFRHRRIVAAVTGVVGSTLLWISFRLQPGDDRFYLTTTALAAVWVIGSFASGPLHLGWGHTRRGDRYARPIVQSLALGVLAVVISLAAMLVVAEMPLLRDPVNDVLDHARFASLPLVAVITLMNGVAEELFFRGALFAAIGRRYPVPISAFFYTLTTIGSGNFMLVVAAGALGLLVGLQRRTTGGVLGPSITHITWSLSMLFLLPPLLGAMTTIS